MIDEIKQLKIEIFKIQLKNKFQSFTLKIKLNDVFVEKVDYESESSLNELKTKIIDLGGKKIYSSNFNFKIELYCTTTKLFVIESFLCSNVIIINSSSFKNQKAWYNCLNSEDELILQSLIQISFICDMKVRNLSTNYNTKIGDLSCDKIINQTKFNSNANNNTNTNNEIKLNCNIQTEKNNKSCIITSTEKYFHDSDLTNINSNCLKSSLDIEGKDIYSNSLGTEGDLFKISKFNKSNQNNISVINKNNISKFIADDNLNNISVLFENPNLLNLLEEELIEGVQKNQNSNNKLNNSSSFINDETKEMIGKLKKKYNQLKEEKNILYKAAENLNKNKESKLNIYIALCIILILKFLNLII